MIKALGVLVLVLAALNVRGCIVERNLRADLVISARKLGEAEEARDGCRGVINEMKREASVQAERLAAAIDRAGEKETVVVEKIRIVKQAAVPSDCERGAAWLLTEGKRVAEYLVRRE